MKQRLIDTAVNDQVEEVEAFLRDNPDLHVLLGFELLPFQYVSRSSNLDVLKVLLDTTASFLSNCHHCCHSLFYCREEVVSGAADDPAGGSVKLERF